MGFALHLRGMEGVKKLAVANGLWAISNEDGTFAVVDSKGRRVSPFDYVCIEIVTMFAWVLRRKNGCLDVLLSDNNWIMNASKVQEEGDNLVVYNRIGEVWLTCKKDEKLVYLLQERKRQV